MFKPQRTILKTDKNLPATKTHGYTERSLDEYHSSRWTKESMAFRESHPVCERCLKNGVVSKAEVTDHIIPAPIHDFWDQTNWQSLCKTCNREKGIEDKKLFKKQRDEKR